MSDPRAYARETGATIAKSIPERFRLAQALKSRAEGDEKFLSGATMIGIEKVVTLSHRRIMRRRRKLFGRVPSAMESLPFATCRAEFVAVLLKRDGDDCWYCGLPLGDDITLEHLVPRSADGPTNIFNMVLAHQSCNRLADNKPLYEKIEIRAAMLGFVARTGGAYSLPDFGQAG